MVNSSPRAWRARAPRAAAASCRGVKVLAPETICRVACATTSSWAEVRAPSKGRACKSSSAACPGLKASGSMAWRRGWLRRTATSPNACAPATRAMRSLLASDNLAPRALFFFLDFAPPATSNSRWRNSSSMPLLSTPQRDSAFLRDKSSGKAKVSRTRSSLLAPSATKSFTGLSLRESSVAQPSALKQTDDSDRAKMHWQSSCTDTW
mmetsp:Transcript_76077/g.137327  ORF Transcript_76077/g.137327 Transcript_76077/m.137327 type:complete len:208 (-) Transcript_76077:314-937(-)